MFEMANKQQPRLDSTKRKQHEVNLQGTPKGFRYDFVLGNWYKLKKAKGTGLQTRHRRYEAIPFTIDADLKQHLADNYDLEVDEGTYGLSQRDGGWVDESNLHSFGSGLESRLTEALLHLTEEAHAKAYENLEYGTREEYTPRIIAKQLLHLANNN